VIQVLASWNRKGENEKVSKKAQRYKCKSCKYNFTTSKKRGAVSKRSKTRILLSYMGGKSMRSVAREYELSHTAVKKIIDNHIITQEKKYGKSRFQDLLIRTKRNKLLL
jgi:transposase-like protein